MKRIDVLSTPLGEKIYPLSFSAEVQEAYERGEMGRVVALESTILCHGLPPPHNLHCALQLEQAIREEGAIPATIAILKGIIHVGLSIDNLRSLVEIGSSCVKTSRRDLAYIVAMKLNGATTVAGTLCIAAMAGIRLMATGGIGGVHRAGETSMDVSADLTELGRSPVMVVCAGVKSILDIGRTLEVLETEGVTVAVLGSETFPAFFVRESDFPAPRTFHSLQDAAALVNASFAMRLQSGSVLAVPIPAENEATDVEAAISSVLREAKEKGVRGAAITPFVLKRVCELSGGASLRANLALVVQNARIAARIACALGRLENTSGRPN